jgi:hypothetical protein
MINILSRVRRPIAIFYGFLFGSQLLAPNVALALTGGPSQPETQTFQAAGVTDMVDLFTGDFGYNIPLFELPGPNGGYPFNLSYQSGIGMDQEASWVGLGWNLNPGAITRQMRGLPDEFKGDVVSTTMSVKENITVGLSAGVGAEIFGGSKGLTLGFSVTHNNFRGLGYSIDGSMGFSRAVGGGMTTGLGIQFSLGNNEGVTLQPSLSLAGKIGEVGLGAGYNSKSGLNSISYSYTINHTMYGKEKRTDKNKVGKQTEFSGSAGLSFSHPGYTPQITMAMQNENLAAQFKPGGSWWGLFPNAYIKGFYNSQKLKKDMETVSSEAYGYLNYQHATGSRPLLDFNREKDGMVTKESPNLAIASLSYDIYSVTGQGISSMYRPMRNEIGFVFDPSTTSTSTGASIGVDVGPAASHVGVNLTVYHSESTSGKWQTANSMDGLSAFRDKTPGSLYEPWFFKIHGEKSAEPNGTIQNMGGDDPLRVQLAGDNYNASASSTFENPVKGKTWNFPGNTSLNNERKERNNVVQPITNEQLVNGSTELLPEFRIKYMDDVGGLHDFDRTQFMANEKHHIAAYVALTPDGLRYNYGIPAYNLDQQEVVFSVPGSITQKQFVETGSTGSDSDPTFKHGSVTDEFFKKVKLPKYPHSHLLTSILGPDYVDVTGDGVTPDDIGYWVKFTYKKTTSSYKWRDPFINAHYQQGWKYSGNDDKGVFNYGVKELWYLARAETKTHIADFLTVERSDGRGARNFLQGAGAPVTEAFSHKLTSIKLYSRFAASDHPIKIIDFTYENILCTDLPNGSAGKSSLTRLDFRYGSTNSQSLNPYLFSYHIVDGHNSYNSLAYDRWGNYKPPSPDNLDFPYVKQDAPREDIDKFASSWSLKQITLPSGGTIDIDYESDDYAYVQHKQAMQMVQVVDPEGSVSDIFEISDDVGVHSSLVKVRFKLEQPIRELRGTVSDRAAEALKYLDTERNQVYFKLLVQLRKASENVEDYVAGYANLAPRDVNGATTCGIETENGGAFNSETNPYVYGFFHLVKEQGNGANKHHPFSLRAWQHIRTNQPELVSSGTKLDPQQSDEKRLDQIRSLGSIVSHVRDMFQGFYNKCNSLQWGRQMKASKSWVRLKSPDKIKYGGGHRVKQITMKDRWTGNDEGVYGQVYQYTKIENGQVISSGVAAYEPIIGGDENALRYAKSYVESIPLRADNNLYFEYPINESYYPGPTVGYSEVTVWSLGSAYRAKEYAKTLPAGDVAATPSLKQIENLQLLHIKLGEKPDGSEINVFPTGPQNAFGTSGKTVYEFYTARDFPVLTGETNKQNKPYKLSVPVPFVGSISISKLTASQGYSIVTNDMHGKQKLVSNYAQGTNGLPASEAISWIKYNYLDKEKMFEGQRVKEVLNTFKNEEDGLTPYVAEGPPPLNGQYFNLGQETEMFSDMRQFQDLTWEGGATANTDVVYIPIIFGVVPFFVPSVWPSVSRSETLLRTISTNKVIFKSGILSSVEAYDGGSRVVTENLVWDKLTGVPILTSVNNNFDDPVFNYTVLAHTQYAGMGAAFKNIGLTFTVSTVVAVPNKAHHYDFHSSVLDLALRPGDELIVFQNGSNFSKPIARAIYVGPSGEDNLLYSQTSLKEQNYECMVVRSGYRNHLSVSAGQISGLNRDISRAKTPVTPVPTKSITTVK